MIKKIREWMLANGVDIYLVTGLDPHLTEYQPVEWRTREMISGFSGSAGILLITQNECNLWTDFRYYIQAEKEINNKIVTLFKDGYKDTPKAVEWISQNIKTHGTIGFDSRTLSYSYYKELEKAVASKDITLIHDKGLLQSLINNINASPTSQCLENWDDESITGKSSFKKITLIKEYVKKSSIDGFFFSSLDDIAWILNLRGWDIPYNPLFCSYLYISKKKILFFCNQETLTLEIKNQLDNLSVLIYDYNEATTKMLSLGSSVIGVDYTSISYYWIDLLSNKSSVKNCPSPATILKGVKNRIEIEHFNECMITDAYVLFEFEKWVKNNSEKDEYQSAKKMSEIRSKAENFLMESFPPITAYGKNAALCHYQASENSCSRLKKQGLFLVDSGSHYRFGTTDITRVFSLGNTTAAHKKCYTLVLKAHIHLATAVFPKGTTGAQLDAIARDTLWRNYMNFGHGTGHGVGFGLMVHESPPRISPLARDLILEEGMIFSNEPGLYFENEFGIRLENLVTVIEKGDFLQLETLTLYPFEEDLIDLTLLNEAEMKWLESYYLKIIKSVHQELSDQVKKSAKNIFPYSYF